MTEPKQPSVVCAHCHRAFPPQGFYTVSRHGGDGNVTGHVRICSLMCLLNWTYGYAAHEGASLAKSVKDTFARIVETIRGGRLP